MTVGKINHGWLWAMLATAAAVTVASNATQASGQVTQSLQRAGRLHGFGWGDGYHTCETSRIRIGADLPPRSVPAGRIAAGRPGLAHRIGETFYDRFDASNGRPCDTQPCDAGGCNCVSSSALEASGGITANESVASPEMWANSDRPSQIAPDLSSTPPFSTQIVAETFEPEKKRPIRPEPPEQPRTRNISIPIAAIEDSGNSFASGLTGPDDVLAAATRSQTPQPIEPVHPFATVDRQVSVERPQVSVERPQSKAEKTGSSTDLPAVPSYAFEMPTELPVKVEPPPAATATELSTAVPSVPAIEIPTIEQTQPAPSQLSLPSGSWRLSADSPRVSAESSRPSSGSVAPRKRPVRIGSSVAQAPSSVAVPQRMPAVDPSRIGVSENVRTNPFASRPVVEMAKRREGATLGVVRQPSSTLK